MSASTGAEATLHFPILPSKKLLQHNRRRMASERMLRILVTWEVMQRACRARAEEASPGSGVSHVTRV